MNHCFGVRRSWWQTFFFCLNMAQTGFAAELRGRLVVNGIGEVSAQPEMAQLEVTVTSMCYETSRAAKEANAQLAQKIVEKMQSFTVDPRDQVVATGGPNVRQTEVIPVGGENKILCERKWRASNHITLKFSRIDIVPDLQDALLEAVDQVSDVSPSGLAQTFAELGQPHFDVYPETSLRLKHEAQAKAYDDALGQFGVFKKRCSFADERLTYIAPPQYEVIPRMRAMAAYAADSATPIIPDVVVYQAHWRFEWSYEAPLGCVP